MPASEDPYPVPCAFCAISRAFPPPGASASPIPENPDASLVTPQCHLVLSTASVLAFLDIMPLARGHVLLITREHFAKLSDVPSAGSESSAAAAAQGLGHWLPALSRALCAVTGVEDWNVVQNNGLRAAQVVPHVHFHLIPRYADLGGAQKTPRAMSWTMFGRGARDDLDDDEAAELAQSLRVALREDLARGKKGPTATQKL